MKILIIEDDQSVAELERDYLEINGGFQCDLHTDGTQGLQAALTEDYALVIVDVMLPGLSGFEICRRLREGRTPPSSSSPPWLTTLTRSGAWAWGRMTT